MAYSKHDEGLDHAVNVLYERIAALRTRFQEERSRRIIIALAGVPGSGKTTVSSALVELFRRKEKKDITVLPMDGFHFPKSALRTFPDPDNAFRRRGAAFTFDVNAFNKLVLALKYLPVTSLDQPELSFRAPSFDHAVQDPIPADIYVSSASSIVILEGNYLLLNEAPWSNIAELADEKWFVDVHWEVAKERLVSRHIRAGIETTRQAATARVEENDMRNADFIRAKLIQPDVVIEN